MKTLRTVFTFVASGLSASSSFAAISLTDTSQSSFNIGGFISPECKVNNVANNTSTALDLTSTSAQTASSVSVWCNTGQSAANTTYASDNDGFLVNETGNRIAYNINVGDQGNDISLSTPQSISQQSGFGENGEEQVTDVAIVPQVNGLEFSGTYSDTISVTVSYN